MQMEPVVRPLFTVAQIEDKIVVSAEISECDLYDKPCFFKGAGRLRFLKNPAVGSWGRGAEKNRVDKIRQDLYIDIYT